MRIYNLRFTIYALLVLCGCAGQQSAIRNRQSAILKSHQFSTLIAPPPPPLIFAFRYSTPLTNCYLESSTDLFHWTVRDDYWIGTNADGTTYWNVRADKSCPREFYRVGGEAIP
jgi:hypothetical protein